jgi:Flp pilus assembly pilin Flp
MAEPLVGADMSGRGNMLRRGISVRAGSAGNEHGAAMAEYVPLLAVIALLLVFAVSFFGPWVSERLLDATAPLHGCPPPFTLSYPDSSIPPPTAHGVDRDLNGDGYLCVQEIPANGNGNTGISYNVKDNNRGPSS